MKVSVTAAGKPVKARHTLKKGRVVIELDKELELSEGESVEVTIQWQYHG